MGIYDPPPRVNPTLRQPMDAQVNNWVNTTAQTMPALQQPNPAAVSGPTALPPQASPVVFENRQRGQYGNPENTGRIQDPRMPRVEEIDPNVPGNSPNNMKPVKIPRVNANNFAAYQAFRPAMQEWRSSRPITAGMTPEQSTAAAQAWFGAKPVNPINKPPTWPGARPVGFNSDRPSG